MRILFVTENFPPETNAPAARVYERARYWVSWGHQITVLTTAPNFPAGEIFDGYENAWRQRERVDGIDVVRVKSFIAPNKGTVLRVADFTSFMCTAFAAGLVEDRPDVVVATSPQFFAGVGGCALALARRLPFVLELADLWPASIRAVGAIQAEGLLRWVEKCELMLYRQSRAIVALTDAFKRDLVSRGVPADKIQVVINGVDLPRYTPRARDAELACQWGLDGKFVVGYVGTHGMAHALGNVLDAAQLLRDDQRIAFMLVGDGAERNDLVARVQREGLRNVIMVPRRAKEEMPAYWSLCNLALIHLKNDPVFSTVIPSKIFEAMGMGLPLLLAAPEGEASAIVSQHGGVVVPAEDPAALARAAVTLESDRERLRGLAETSLASAPLFTRERQARDMLRVLERFG